MSRSIISLALLFAALFVSVQVRATDYALFVGGRQVSGGDTAFNVTKDGKVKYDPRSRTLTLRGVVLRDTLCAIHNVGIDSLTILLEGIDSIFTTGSDAIRLDRRTFIRSNDFDGRLYVNASKSSKKDSLAHAALRTSGCGTLRISDCSVQLTGDAWALRSDADDSLAIVTAEVTAQSNDTLRSCIEGFRAIYKRSVFIMGSAYYNPMTKSLCLFGSDKVKLQQVSIYGNLYVGNYIVDVERRDTVPQRITAASSGLKKGRLWYDYSRGQLTLDSAVVQTTGLSAIRNLSWDLLKIGIKGSVSISSTGSTAITLMGSTTFMNAGNTAARLTVKGSADGIYQAGQFYGLYSGCELTFSGIDVEVEAGRRGIFGDGNASTLRIQSASMRVGSTTSAAFQAITGFNACSMKNVDVANGTAWRRATGSFCHNDGTVAHDVVIGVPTMYFPVVILNHVISDVNCANFAADGMEGTGYVSYDPATMTLTLSNMAIRRGDDGGFYYGQAIYVNEPGATITVSGNVSIVHDTGITAVYGCTLAGPGTLSIEASEGSAIFAGGKEPFTIACAALIARGAEYGFNDFGRGGLILQAATGTTATRHTFAGGSGNINTPALTLSEMNFLSPACCYFVEGQGVYQNGWYEKMTGELTFGQVTRRYGVKVMGTEIDNCNAGGIGSPYIHQADFMHYDEATRTLTLNDFDVTSTDMEMNILDVSSEGIQLVANGYCSFSTAAGAAIKVANTQGGKASLTIRGEGTLNVHGKFFALLVGANGSVTFADKVQFNGDGGISGNNYGTKGETLTVRDEAYVVCTGNDTHPAVEQFAKISIDGIGQRIVKPNWGSATKLNSGYAIVNTAGEAEQGLVILGQPRKHGMFIGEIQVSNANEDDIDGTGQFRYYPAAKTLMLNDARLDNTSGLSGMGIGNEAVEGLTIVLCGDNSIATRGDAIYSEKAITITGDGTLNANATQGAAVWLLGADCTISGPTMTMKGAKYAIHGDKSREALRIEGTATHLTLRNNGIATVSGIGSFTLGQGLFITRPARAAFSETHGGITVDGSLWNGTIEISSQDPSSDIDDIIDDDARPTDIYDHAGRQLRQQQHGINILRLPDGTTRKVINTKK